MSVSQNNRCCYCRFFEDGYCHYHKRKTESQKHCVDFEED